MKRMDFLSPDPISDFQGQEINLGKVGVLGVLYGSMIELIEIKSMWRDPINRRVSWGLEACTCNK